MRGLLLSDFLLQNASWVIMGMIAGASVDTVQSTLQTAIRALETVLKAGVWRGSSPLNVWKVSHF
jgi:hypothetical protein